MIQRRHSLDEVKIVLAEHSRIPVCNLVEALAMDKRGAMHNLVWTQFIESEVWRVLDVVPSQWVGRIVDKVGGVYGLNHCLVLVQVTMGHFEGSFDEAGGVS